MFGEWHGPAAEADALDPFVVAEHARGDRSLVPHLSEQELDLAYPAAAALASDAVPQPGPGSARGAGCLPSAGGEAQAVGQDGHVGHLLSATSPVDDVLEEPDPRRHVGTPPSTRRRLSCALQADGTRARRTPRSRRLVAAAPTEAVRPPVSTMDPASRDSPRAPSASASHTTAAAGWPITAPPAAVSIAPRHRKTQPRTLRSTSSSGRRPRLPRTIRTPRPRCRPRSRAAGTTPSSESRPPRRRGRRPPSRRERRRPWSAPRSRGRSSKAISGSARGWIRSCEADRFAGPHDHA